MKVRPALQREIIATWRWRPVRRDTVFYESFDGNGALCNPEAIFRRLHGDPEFRHLKHVWSLLPGHEGDRLRVEFAHDPRVRFVTRGRSAWVGAISTSGWLVTNATFPRWFSKRPGQTYLNTWHGVPLKKMGYDIGDAPARVGNVVRNLLHADVLLSTGPYMTDRLYRSAHRLGGLYRGLVLETGYPRIDRQFADDAELTATREALAAIAGPLGDREIVLYAPTWRGTNFSRPTDDAEALLATTRALQEALGPDRLVLLKTHQVVHEFARGRADFAGVLVPNDLPSNQVLAVTDRLVTDYSSIFFDFLTTGRPIHHLVPDIDDYGDYRGLYLAPDEWPGTVSRTVDETVAAILADQRPPAFAGARERFVPHDDGHATDRVVDAVFRRRPVAGVELGPRDRPTVLVIVGGPPDDARRARIDAELSARAADGSDVSILVSDSRRPAFLAWQLGLGSGARVLVRQGRITSSTAWLVLRRIGVGSQKKMWREEWRRVVGDARFDRVIDLSGNADFWAPLAGGAPDTAP